MNYFDELQDALGAIDWVRIESAGRMLRKSHFVMTAGNGGSSAIASHFCVDYMKVARSGCPCVCLTDNVPLLTALVNDHKVPSEAWRETLVQASEAYGAINPTVIAISSSGNSPNVVRLVEHCLRVGNPLVALTGFSGDNGVARAISWYEQNSDLRTKFTHLHVPSHDYGVVEDSHGAILHAIIRELKDE